MKKNDQVAEQGKEKRTALLAVIYNHLLFRQVFLSIFRFVAYIP